MLRNCYAALEYILWLVFSTTLLLCVIVSVDMYLGYIELTKHINSSPVTHKNNSNGQDIAKKNQDAGTSVASDNGEINANKGLHKKHKILGWIPAEHAQVSDVLSNNYDVTYTIDGDGFRTTPSRPDAKHTIYIFGDSFTFGQGVDDEETFSSILSSDWLYEDYKVVNAGVNGYGITQMYGRYLEIEHKSMVYKAMLQSQYCHVWKLNKKEGYNSMLVATL